jgi:hypothetical protein
MSIVGVLDGDPMLRKVTRVDWWEDGSLYFATKDVSLTDVVRKAHADRRVVDLHPFEFKRNDLKLAEGEGVNITCTTCELTFDPKLEYQFDLTPDAVESLGLALKGKLVGDVAVDIASPEGRSTLSREVVLANKTDRFVQRLGPIPIWEDTSISLIATIKGKTNGEAHVLSKLHVEKDIAFGSFLEQGQWVVEEAPEEGTYVYEHPVLEAKVDGSVSVALKLRLSASVVGIASAKVDADADASANLQICPMPSTWTMQGKLKISAGAKLAIPFMDPYEIDKEIYRKEGTREVKSPSNAPALCR